MKRWAPSKEGITLSKVPQLGTKKTPANHRHYSQRVDPRVQNFLS